VVKLYGVRCWGSAITEAMLALAGETYEFIDVAGFDQPGATRQLLAGVNPLVQVPTVILDDGTVLTETAAIAIWILHRHPSLAPAHGSAAYTMFLRLLIWMVANVYPTFTYGDIPERWVESSPSQLTASTDRYREGLYLWLEQELVGPFSFGDNPTVFDCYLAVMIDWRPRAEWFRKNTPKLFRAAEATRAIVALRPVFPDVENAATFSALTT
jgi:GST-like protein